MIRASAPGNIMLLGEHAVLHGHSAIACAVAKRIHVELAPRNDAAINIKTALGNYHSKVGHCHVHPKLNFCLAAINLQNPKQGFDLAIKSEFSHTVGLGSSAAVTAATLGALCQWQCQSTQAADIFAKGLQVIKTVQGRGSGSDLAASVYGGMLAYNVAPRNIEPLLTSATALPQLDLFYVGYKTPTVEVLEMVHNYTKSQPALYASLYQHMQLTSSRAIAAIRAQDWQELGHLFNHYHGLMDALGVNDLNLAKIVFAARACAGVYGAKISGSGLGDCVVTIAANGTKININDEHIRMQIDPQGLLVEELQCPTSAAPN